MNRKQLIETLELVKPALADDGLVPIFTNFCFDDNVVYAYKDRLGIVATCAVGETFAVNGKTMLDLLKTSSVTEVEFQLVDDQLLMTAGKSKMKLPYMGKSEFLFEEPEDEKWDIMLSIDEHMLHGLELCLVTSSNDATMPALMGVTIKGGKTSYFYSCDGDALSRYQLEESSSKSAQFTIPNEFCKALLNISDKTGNRAGQLYVNQEWVLAELDNYKIFGRIIENPEPLDFEKQISKVLKSTPNFVSVPDTLESALNRARVLADPESKPTVLSIEKGKLKVKTETHLGVANDTLKIDESHKPVEASVSAKLVSRAIGICDEFALFEACTVYRSGEDFFLLIANYNE